VGFESHRQIVTLNEKGDKAMKLHINGKTFTAESTYAEKDIPKNTGFRWNPEKKIWWTDQKDKAYKLLNYADDECKTFLEEWKSSTDKKIETSSASSANITLPVPEGIDYMPFQKAGIKFAIESKNTLFGDEMGLGKTIQAIGVINADETIKKILVISPASLKINWKREIEKWSVGYSLSDSPMTNFPILTS